MSQSYTKACMFCKQEIVMSDKASGNWLPYNLDGKALDCKSQKETGTKNVETNSNSKPLTVEERLARREAIIFKGEPRLMQS
jgi:hypothetical protein